MHTDKEKMFIRQTTLPEIGLEGQEKLINAKVVIIGCGGLGSAAAVSLAASGVGHIHLIDFDKISLSNLHRQVFYRVDQVGMSKAKVLASYLQKISPQVSASFDEVPLTKQNIASVLTSYSLIVDCTDSLAAKYLINDYCVLNKKTLVYGSLYKHDGYAGVFNVKTDDGYSAHLRDAFPSMPLKHVPNCSEIGTLNPIVGIIGLMQANEVIKIITGTGKNLINSILIYNSMENTQFVMKLNPVFSLKKLKQIYEQQDYFDAGCEPQDPSLLIGANELKLKIIDDNIKIISVIENTNTTFPFPVHLKIPMSEFEASKLEGYLQNEMVIVCQKGVSSYRATKAVKELYPQSMVFSLKDGIEQY